MEKTYQIEGMKCEGCAKTVQETLTQVAGVTEVTVDLNQKTATVMGDVPEQALPHIVTKPFMETFTVGLGGSGMTLAVVILMAFVLKKKQYRDVGRLALAPGIFNVNEPAIFGMPIVLNATILIPWVVAPLVVTTFNYLVMAAGLVPAPTGVSVPWTVPVIASGVLATNSWLGGLLQVIDVVVVGMIWYPFLRILDRQQEASIN